MSLIERLRHRYTGRVDEDEAAELRTRSDVLGVVCIADAADRSWVEVSGVARSLTRPPVGEGTRQLVVELYDGTSPLDVIWLGRREIPGIHPGVHLRVHGRVSRGRGRCTMYNPRYEIIPGL